MSKWADYCITAVRFNEKRTHIERAKRRLDKGESLGEPSIVTRETVIADLRSGTTYVTAFRGSNNKWDGGQTLFITDVNGVEYIKTSKDNSTKDNLEELPEF
jgi:hypothetical protein